MPLAKNLEHIWHQHQDAISIGEAALALRGHYPAWQVRLDGVVTAANLLALWLWGAKEVRNRPVPSDILGRNVFDIYAASLGRIPPAKNRDFYTAKFKVEHALFGDDPNSPLAQASRTDNALQQIYHQIDRYTPLGNIWEYILRITSPKDSNDLQFLKFNTYVYRLFADGEPSGYIAVYTPLGQTRDIISRKVDEYSGAKSYVAHYTSQGGDLNTKEHEGKDILRNLQNESTDQFVARLRAEATRFRREREERLEPSLTALTDEDTAELRRIDEERKGVRDRIAAWYKKGRTGGETSNP